MESAYPVPIKNILAKPGYEVHFQRHARKSHSSCWIVFLSTFPPRQCGLATFTEDFCTAFNHLFAPGVQTKVVAINPDHLTRFNYPGKVIAQVSQSRERDYLEAAERLNAMDQVRIVSVQHEFGIFGGELGSNVLAFVRALTKPLVVTFHTVLPDPSPAMRAIVNELGQRAQRIVVMTALSENVLIETYGIAVEKVVVIAHGIHPQPLAPTKAAKAYLGFPSRDILATFGFLSRSKGLEYVIDALPTVAKRFPGLLYLIVGTTHPVVLREEGESYRRMLEERVRKLGMDEHVRFYDRYAALPELLQFLKATDVYVSTSLSPEQATSGTLSYALGAGRPVVSTAFSQAREDITPDVGRLVDFRDPAAYAQALCELLSDQEARKVMGRNAYVRTRNRTWPNVAIQHMRMFAELDPSLGTAAQHLPKIKLSQVMRLTDTFGIMQFANLAEPDPSFGYTADDNARALLAACFFHHRFHSPVALRLAAIYLDFLQYVRRDDGFFDNYVRHDRSRDTVLNEGESMEDPTARCLYAVAVAGNQRSLPSPLRMRAQRLFSDSLHQGVRFTSLRAAAFYVKALCEWLSRHRDHEAREALTLHCDLLLNAFRLNATTEWPWFEDHLTYSNALLPEALLRASRFYAMSPGECFSVGKATLDFLIAQTFRNGMYVAIGQDGWYRRDGRRTLYDQQPEDPAAMVMALRAISSMTGKLRYRQLMHQAFTWFLGENISHRIMYDESTGGCYDGFDASGVNLNQGAESTLSYLLARLSVE